MKIREKIKMKRTAEDLVIVYLEARIPHNALLQPGTQATSKKRARSTIRELETGKLGGYP